MGNFDDTKPKSAEETLKDSLDLLKESLDAVETFRFNFASFVSSFERSLIKSKLLGKDGK